MKVKKQMEQESRDLVTICEEEGGFALELLGNVYCQLSYQQRIDCPYHSHHKDKNELHTCNHPLYQSLHLDNGYRC